jgi:hypothetical protein
MTLLGIIVTTVVTLVVVAGAFYLGKLVGYMKGAQDVMSSFTGIDLRAIVKDEMKEMFSGKSQ